LTLPTITYGVPWQTDCGDTSGWTIDDGASTATLTVDDGTIFNINVTVSAGAKSVYCEYDFTDISSTAYGNIYIMYKTGDNNIKAKVVLYFTAGTQEVLAETSNTDWTLANAEITTAKTIDKIRIYATQATGDVYFHWIMIYKGTFTFPDFKKCTVKFPLKKPVLGIPGRDTDVTQHLGRKNARITIEGDMQSGETWGSLTGASADSSPRTYGEYLYLLLRERKWQWLTTDQGSFKVMLAEEGPTFAQDVASGQQRTYIIPFEECELGDTSAATFDGSAWYGVGLT